MATFDLGNRVKIVSKAANVDSKYGPYLGTSVELALEAANTALQVGGDLREKGLTVGIIVNGGAIEEYWYELQATSSADLKKKGATSGVQNSEYTPSSVLVGGVTTGTTASVTLTDNTVLGKVGSNAPSAVPVITNISAVSAINDQLIYAKAIKDYIDSIVASSTVFQTGYDAFNNVPALDTLASGNGVLKGWIYIVSAAGSFFTKQVYIGDHVIANQDSPTSINHWTVIENGLQLATDTFAGIIEIATPAEVVAGTASNLAVTPATLKSTLGTTSTLSIPKKFTTPILSTSASIAYTHGLNTKDAMVIIRQLNSPYQEVDADIEFTDNNTVTVSFLTAPLANTYQLTIIG